MRHHEPDDAANPADPDARPGAIGEEIRLTARSWRAFALTAALTGVLLLALTHTGTAFTLGAAGVLALLAAVLAALRAFRLEHPRPTTTGQHPLPGRSAVIPAVAALTIAVTVLAAISLLS